VTGVWRLLVLLLWSGVGTTTVKPQLQTPLRDGITSGISHLVTEISPRHGINTASPC
jgi:hypothetical protein